MIALFFEVFFRIEEHTIIDKVILQMKLSVNHSSALVHLLIEGALSIDAIEMVDKVSPAEIAFARQSLPALETHYHQGRMLFNNKGYNHLANYLQLCPDSPFISIHLAPLPAYITFPALKWSVYLPEANRDRSVQRFIQQVKNAQKMFSLPIILENMPVLHPSKYFFESDPQVISEVLKETGCDMLLDLAHARISAEARHLSPEDYLASLPLENVVQVHLAGTRRVNGLLTDAHDTLEEADYRLLGWTLQRCQPKWLTLEYFREERGAVKLQIERLQHFLN